MWEGSEVGMTTRPTIALPGIDNPHSAKPIIYLGVEWGRQ